jgi:hypothetical protein
VTVRPIADYGRLVRDPDFRAYLASLGFRQGAHRFIGWATGPEESAIGAAKRLDLVGHNFVILPDPEAPYGCRGEVTFLDEDWDDETEEPRTDA